MSFVRFSFPTPILFGAGARNELPRVLKEEGKSRPLIVTDRGIAPLPFLSQLRKGLENAGQKVAVFSEVWGNPVKSQVAAGVLAFRAHKADAIVGIGGGAALDVAKAIALMAHHPGDLFDYEDEKPGALPITHEIPYWIALPTTAGTGSEVGRSTVISDEKTHIKKIIFSPRLLARTVLADPELTLELPAKVTAATGMDALTHCIEAFLSKGFHPICDGIALEGLSLGAKSLAKCVKEPQNIEARGHMLMSSMMGAIAFQKGLGLTHSCAHALSTVVDLHHGLANGIMIDHALPFNVSIVPERFKRLAEAIGLKEKTPDAFFGWLSHLKKEIGIPANLSAAGISRDKIPALVKVATSDACHACNPGPVSASDFEKIFTEAF
jgi:alcohol dehydrogenase class IV